MKSSESKLVILAKDPESNTRIIITSKSNKSAEEVVKRYSDKYVVTHHFNAQPNSRVARSILQAYIINLL